MLFIMVVSDILSLKYRLLYLLSTHAELFKREFNNIFAIVSAIVLSTSVFVNSSPASKITRYLRRHLFSSFADFKECCCVSKCNV
jgi:hypothetical protein